MRSEEIKRELTALYMNVGAEETPEWKLIGQSVVDHEIHEGCTSMEKAWILARRGFERAKRRLICAITSLFERDDCDDN